MPSTTDKQATIEAPMTVKQAATQVARRSPDDALAMVESIPEVDESLQGIAILAKETGTLMAAVSQGIQVEFRVAKGMQLMRQQLTPDIMNEYVMPLVGTRLGFRTDRDQDRTKSYSPDEIRDVVIDAMIRGARLVGEELTVISGGPHYTVNYYRRTIFDIDGLDKLVVTNGEPEMVQGLQKSARVPVRITFELHGRPCFHEGSYVVRVNDGQMATATQTKAERLALKSLKQALVGSTWAPDDAEAVDGAPLRIGSGKAPDGAFATFGVEGGGSEPLTPADAIEKMRAYIGQSGVDNLDARALEYASTEAGKPVTWEKMPLLVYPRLKQWVTATVAAEK